jgi:hypothetical protein
VKADSERLDAVLAEAARQEPTYLDFLDQFLQQETAAKQRKLVITRHSARAPRRCGRGDGPRWTMKEAAPGSSGTNTTRQSGSPTRRTTRAKRDSDRSESK